MARFAAGENIDGKLISIEALVNVMIQKWNDQLKKDNSDIKEAHIKALDDLVSVNSLFTVAVFIGLSMASRGQQSIETREECQAGIEYKKMLLLYEVLAFACFVLSSLVAKVIKLHLIIQGDRFYNFVHRNLDWKDILLILSAGTSIAGIVLVTLSVLNIIQIRMGLLSCGSAVAWWSVWSVSIIVGIGLVIYVLSMILAIIISIKSDKHAALSGTPTTDANNICTDHIFNQDSLSVGPQGGCVIQLAAHAHD